MLRLSQVLRLLPAVFGAWLLLSAGPALAQWRVQEGIDIATGGTSILLIGTLDERTSFYAQCIGGSKRLFLEAFDGKDEELAGSGLVDIGLTLDRRNETLWWTLGQQSRRPSYLMTEWTDASVFDRVIADIMSAQAEITFSIYTPVVRTITDWTVSASGSTAAGRDFLALCSAQSTGTQPTPQQQPAPQLQPLPEQQPPSQEPQQLPPLQQPPAGESAWTFSPGSQPELIGPANDGLQLVIACVQVGVAIVLVEATDIQNFPTIRSSRDGLLILAFDDADPLPIVVAPGPARPGVLTVVAEDPNDGAAVAAMLSDRSFQSLVMLVGNVDSQDQILSTHSLAGAADAALAFRTACTGDQ